MSVATLNLTDMRAEIYSDVFSRDGKGPIAFVAVIPEDKMDGINGALGMAVANERGYTPVPLGWARYASLDAAESHANHLNRHLGLTDLEATKIVASTMGGMKYHAPAAESSQHSESPQ